MKLVIDKGHGSHDPGAIGNSLQEADLTGFIGDTIKNCLTDYDAEVYLAPRGELSERSAFAASVKADFFVSVHTNSSAKVAASGFESFAHLNATQDTVRICEGIHADLASFYTSKGITVRDFKRANFAVLRNTTRAGIPSILLENLFISNKKDADSLKDKNFLLSLGYTIAMSIVRVFSIKRKVVVMPENEEIKQVKIKVKGKEITGVVIGGRTIAPVRALAEALGYKVTWDDKAQAVVVE